MGDSLSTAWNIAIIMRCLVLIGSVLACVSSAQSFDAGYGVPAAPVLVTRVSPLPTQPILPASLPLTAQPIPFSLPVHQPFVPAPAPLAHPLPVAPVPAAPITLMPTMSSRLSTTPLMTSTASEWPPPTSPWPPPPPPWWLLSPWWRPLKLLLLELNISPLTRKQRLKLLPRNPKSRTKNLIFNYVKSNPLRMDFTCYCSMACNHFGSDA